MDKTRFPISGGEAGESSKDGAPTKTDGRELPKVVFLYPKSTLVDLPKDIAYTCGGVLTGVNIRQTDKGWQAIVKRTRRGRHEVAFLECDLWAEVVDNVAQWASQGLFQWHVDRFPPKN